MIITKHVTAGDWRTLESFWNAKATAFFRHPDGAKVRVRYGGNSWWNGRTGSEETLTGNKDVKLTVGFGSIAYARLQIRVQSDTSVTYNVFPGTVAAETPEIPF